MTGVNVIEHDRDRAVSQECGQRRPIQQTTSSITEGVPLARRGRSLGEAYRRESEISTIITA
jgi:hypothetical protein